jgi:hypothetical protein
MSTMHLIIDGMLSGTGIRDGDQGGYLDASDLGISPSLSARISEWLGRYENAHFFQFEDKAENQLLDSQGLEIARLLKSELPNVRITYFSNAKLKELPIN